MRRAVTLVAMMAALLLGGIALAHNDSCLLVVHAGGIQQHLVCS